MTATTLTQNRAVHMRETRLTVDRGYACPDWMQTAVIRGPISAVCIQNAISGRG